MLRRLSRSVHLRSQPTVYCQSFTSLTATNPLQENPLELFVRANTCLVRPNLTPSIQLHLITPTCPMYTWGQDDLDNSGVGIPYWSVYWPGGQALTKYILESDKLFTGKNVLDLGAGGGSACIAAVLRGAKSVIANDIDPYALAATRLNVAANLNQNAERVTFSNANFLTTPPILPEGSDGEWIACIGDMFYDHEMADCIRSWICEARRKGVGILIGDPGRHALSAQCTEHGSDIVEYNGIFLKNLARYGLRNETTSYLDENAFDLSHVWQVIE
ncbi:S-adenosyl-L-methionine-dependent methyltransferase [Phlyctochytrium arcticum]|nr:S-adenosyl-L-methionine-dependent methyltransferase [Phlyctochytrium arcticum]